MKNLLIPDFACLPHYFRITEDVHEMCEHSSPISTISEKDAREPFHSGERHPS